MEDNRAEAITNAILQPDPRTREELRRKREAEDRNLFLARSTAAFVLVGYAVGAAAAGFAGEDFAAGGLWGGIGGAVAGRIIGSCRMRTRERT